jgi:2'-5' RNA ligase
VSSKPPGSGGLRLFVAVELPEAVLKALERVQAELDTRGVRARWTRPANLHLTLKFLGATPAGRVEAAEAALSSAAAAHDPFVLTAAGIGVFPNPRRPRVIWAGLAGEDDALARLQAEIDRALDAVGFPREARGFHGHLTLGRFAEGAGTGGIAAAVADYAAASFGSFEVGEVVLFQSDLKPGGAVYTALARARLNESF